MAQASDRKLISIQLTPMRIPEAVPLAGLQVAGPAEATTVASQSAASLLLHPGEPSEMIVQVKNLGKRPIWLNLRVEGNFPVDWCRIGMEGHELAPGQQMEAVLYFQVNASYFEDQQALSPQKRRRLDLDFQSRLYFFHGTNALELDQVELEEFSLHVRAHSLYLNYLPVLYREVDFIGRFLKIFEETFEPAYHSLEAMWANLDPLTAPQTLLPFLAYWVSWPIDARWDLPQQRRLIKRAVEIYRNRGTRRGLILYLHLYTGLPLDDHIAQEAGKHISISDHFGRGFVLGAEHLGQGTVLGGGRPFHFVVRLREQRPNQVNERLVRLIIEQERPAFCTYDLFIEGPPAPPPPRPGQGGPGGAVLPHPPTRFARCPPTCCSCSGTGRCAAAPPGTGHQSPSKGGSCVPATEYTCQRRPTSSRRPESVPARSSATGPPGQTARPGRSGTASGSPCPGWNCTASQTAHPGWNGTAKASGWWCRQPACPGQTHSTTAQTARSASTGGFLNFSYPECYGLRS